MLLPLFSIGMEETFDNLIARTREEKLVLSAADNILFDTCSFHPTSSVL